MSKPKPIFSLRTLFQICYDLKKQGKKIGLTHGAFDLFHSSHLDLLKKSSSICDFLIVGIEGDNNVARYKSYKRPIVNEKDRADLINEIHCVDATFINSLPLESSTYTQLYKELSIDVVTIGKRFQYEDVIEEQVKRSGAELEKIQTEQLPTTTSVIQSIIKKYQDTETVPKEES